MFMFANYCASFLVVSFFFFLSLVRSFSCCCNSEKLLHIALFVELWISLCKFEIVYIFSFSEAYSAWNRPSSNQNGQKCFQSIMMMIVMIVINVLLRMSVHVWSFFNFSHSRQGKINFSIAWCWTSNLDTQFSANKKSTLFQVFMVYGCVMQNKCNKIHENK